MCFAGVGGALMKAEWQHGITQMWLKKHFDWLYANNVSFYWDELLRAHLQVQMHYYKLKPKYIYIYEMQIVFFYTLFTFY